MDLDSGIKDLVITLQAAGWVTTDSGDGSKYGKMEGALPYRHVFIQVDPKRLVSYSHMLQDCYPEAIIEANYNPKDRIALIGLFPDGY